MAAPVLAPATFRAVLIETLHAENYDDNKVLTTAFLEVYASLRDSVRVYFLSPEVVSNLVWPEFRNNDLALDALMRFSMSFHLRLHEVGFTELFNTAIANGLKAAGNGHEAYMDSDFAGKLVDGSRVNAMPGWLTFLVYCFMEPVFVLGILKPKG